MKLVNIKKTTCTALVAGIMLICLCSSAIAGNRQMVEENVKELDEMNKQAVRQIPDLPENGKVDIKADVSYRDDSPVFDIYYKNITSEKEHDIEFDQDNPVNPQKGEN